MIKVLVVGAGGRMGTEVVKVVSSAEDMELVAVVDPGLTQRDVAPGVLCEPDLVKAIEQAKPDVMVDFTHPSIVERDLAIALSFGVDCVVGTTGLTEERLAELAATAPDGTCLFFAPNFAIGAVLMMRLAEMAARYMPHVEILELHHDRKADAPSGTALLTAQRVAKARSSVPDSPGRETELEGMEGARGAVVEGVTVHSVRLPGLVAHQEVLFGGQGQTLSIRHDSIDRTSFMPGVLLAIRSVGTRSGLVVGLEQLMGE